MDILNLEQEQERLQMKDKDSAETKWIREIVIEYDDYCNKNGFIPYYEWTEIIKRE